MTRSGSDGRLPEPGPRGTKRRILHLLLGREQTAGEIAATLGVTANGARFHLTELERDGLVVQRPVRRGARKPSYGYSLTERGEALLPKRYDALLNAFLHDARERADAEPAAVLFRRLGRRLGAEQAHRFAGLPAERRAGEALRLVAELGGAAELVSDAADPQRLAIEGRACPIGAVVREHPEACALLEALLAEVLPGCEVRETCRKAAAGPRCRFEIRQPVS